MVKRASVASPQKQASKKTFVPAHCILKEKFNSKTVVSILNDYYAGNEGASIRFKIFDDSVKSANVINMANCSLIPQLQKQLEDMKPGEKFDERITIADVQSPIYFLSTYRKTIAAETKAKAKADGKSPAEIKKMEITYPVEFKNIVEINGIKPPTRFDGNQFAQACRHLLVSDKMVLKLFNRAFSQSAEKGSPIKRIPLQRAPKNMMKVIEQVVDKIDRDSILDNAWIEIIKTIDDPSIPTTTRVAFTDKRIKTAVIEDRPLFCKGAPKLERRESVTNSRTKKVTKIDYSNGNKEEELNYARKVYQEFKKVKVAIDKTEELMKRPNFADSMNLFTELVGKASSLSEKLGKIKKSSSQVAQLTTFITCLSEMNKLFEEVYSNAKSNDHIQTILTMLKKYGIYLNLKKPAVRKAIISGESPATIAKNNPNLINQITTVKSHDMFAQETYANLGMYIYKNWDSTTEVVKLPKFVRVAIGFAIFKFLMNETEKQISSHAKAKTISIALKM